MTTSQLLLLRLYMMTLGRFAIFARLFRRVSVFLFISRKKEEGYHASSRFFSIRELD